MDEEKPKPIPETITEEPNKVYRFGKFFIETAVDRIVHTRARAIVMALIGGAIAIVTTIGIFYIKTKDRQYRDNIQRLEDLRKSAEIERDNAELAAQRAEAASLIQQAENEAYRRNIEEAANERRRLEAEKAESERRLRNAQRRLAATTFIVETDNRAEPDGEPPVVTDIEAINYTVSCYMDAINNGTSCEIGD